MAMDLSRTPVSTETLTYVHTTYTYENGDQVVNPPGIACYGPDVPTLQDIDSIVEFGEISDAMFEAKAAFYDVFRKTLFDSLSTKKRDLSDEDKKNLKTYFVSRIAHECLEMHSFAHEIAEAMISGDHSIMDVDIYE